MKNSLNFKVIILFAIYFLLKSNVAFSQTYCIPTYTLGTQGANGNYLNNDYVQSVTLIGDNAPGINSNLNTNGPNIFPWNGGPAPFSIHPPDYENITTSTIHPNVNANLSATFPMTTYSVAYQCGTNPANNYMAGFIDFNHDGDFNDIIGGVSEKIFQSGTMASNQVNVATFLVPGSALGGCTVFRVREVNGGANIDPCASYTYGETEDYQVCIISNSVGVGENAESGFYFASIENTNSNSIDLVFYSDKTDAVSYSIFDVTGRMILNGEEKKVQSGVNKISLPFNFSNGIYNVVLQGNDNRVIKKFFKH